MLSLDNALDEAELRAFDARVRELVGAERRSVTWRNSRWTACRWPRDTATALFTQAITRGDGTHGRRRHGKCAHHPLAAVASDRQEPEL